MSFKIGLNAKHILRHQSPICKFRKTQCCFSVSVPKIERILRPFLFFAFQELERPVILRLRLLAICCLAKGVKMWVKVVLSS